MFLLKRPTQYKVSENVSWQNYLASITEITLQKGGSWFREYLVAVVLQQQVEVPAPFCM